ncbi:MAG: hydrogenase maturation protease [Candidatus Thiodiazotropha sp. (ex Monitilora ramsayi)]|nr:hydrogenase maturation protease [Candidatus Thiodiazotropha sp. (ex Monitilora ramsayi)]
MIRVIGVGSPFGADQLGWMAIDHLATLGLVECELLKLDRPGSRLLDHFRDVSSVVVIDAVAVNDRPGGVSALSLSDLQQIQCTPSSHGFGLAETLALGGQLGKLPTDFHLIGIHTGETLSAVPILDLASLEALVLPLI